MYHVFLLWHLELDTKLQIEFDQPRKVQFTSSHNFKGNFVDLAKTVFAIFAAISSLLIKVIIKYTSADNFSSILAKPDSLSMIPLHLFKIYAFDFNSVISSVSQFINIVLNSIAAFWNATYSS